LFRINTFGQLAVCQTLLPLVRKAGKNGKIFNYGSGAVAGNPPTAGSYNMSKHAAHGLTMTLRLELAPWGTQVTSIWPGAVWTGMTEDSRTTTANSWNKQPDAVKEAYEPYLKHGICEALPEMIEKRGSTPEYVCDEVIKLIDKSKLKPYYLIGKKDAEPLDFMYKWLPNSLFETIIKSSYKIPTAK
jgi:NAD(P)-dependent dehydrogenase (short-subunit alcohol dehydrogenase family)